MKPFRPLSALLQGLDDLRYRALKHLTRDDAVMLSGHLYLDTPDGSVYLGRNRVTRPFRNFVAGIIARPAATAPATPETSPVTVSYAGDPGLDTSDLVFPVHLGIGRSSTAPSGAESYTLDPIQVDVGSPGSPVLEDKLFPLHTIVWWADPAQYGNFPISVAFHFDLPELTSAWDPGASESVTDFQIAEWVLLDENGRALARKVAPFNKLHNFGVTLRWEIRT